MSRKALVTVACGPRGPKYQAAWKNVFSRSWRPYAERHGYDVILIDDYIDPTSRATERPPHWQKCLILEHPDVQGYDHVVWLDVDIMINFHQAPCIVGHHDDDRVGLISYRQANRIDARHVFLREDRMDRWGEALPDLAAHNRDLRRAGAYGDLYVRAGLPGDVDDYTNTGVLVLRPHHREVMRHIYDTYENDECLVDNMPISYHLLKNNLHAFIDPRFNTDLVWEYMEHYPFLLQPAFVGDRYLRVLAINALWHGAWFLHCLTGTQALSNDYSYIQINAREPEVYPALRKWALDQGLTRDMVD